MKTIPINEQFDASVTQMRVNENPELQDGNMIPRLCQFVGEAACKDACKLLETTAAWPDPKPELNDFKKVAGAQCAEVNILTTLESLGTKPEQFVLASCTGDRGVNFGDNLSSAKAAEHKNGYTVVPATNAFFFRPGVDKTPQGTVMTHAAMRMADCGDVIYAFKDSDDQDVAGIAHFSRTNMRGPSAYMHELNGKQVSWGEYVIGSAVEHYGANPKDIKITLVAAVNRENFVHHFTDKAKMEKTFPGWNELGFTHPLSEGDFDCDIDYREMIRWQLEGSIQDESLQLRPEQIDTGNAIDTGDVTQGHASHRAAQKGLVDQGRDMYIIGRTV